MRMCESVSWLSLNLSICLLKMELVVRQTLVSNIEDWRIGQDATDQSTATSILSCMIKVTSLVLKLWKDLTLHCNV